MVIAGKDRGTGSRQQPRPARGAPSAAKTQPSGRGRSRTATTGARARTSSSDSYDECSNSDTEVPEKATARRKSNRGQRSRQAKLPELRRSSRLRNRPGNMFDGLRASSVQSELKAISDMKNKRRLVIRNISHRFFSQPQKNRPLVSQRNLTDIEEEKGDKTLDQDSDCGLSIDAKTSRASSLYNEARANDFLKNSFRIYASGPNTIQCRNYRPSPWIRRADSDEDSDDSDACPPPRCRPLNQDRSGAGLADIDPMAIDQTVGFDSIGGLSGQISALKEMVLFPLLYPEVFENFKIQPPRGCLFHGPPGTGKTLVARALANECCHGSREVSFFMRKGADCLSKWVGESERQLRLLFEQAYKSRPAIIFFDEIDGLAPVRSSRQDQIHSSIVSTLLALMDGLDSRGEVVVIGATNRLDAIDPALRRPGRFDREFLFGLPDLEARKDILKIHTRQWSPAPSDDFLEELAQKCVGYCGADLRGVCAEAVLCSLRRRYPQIYGTSLKLQLDLGSIAVTTSDFLNAMKRMNPASQRGNNTAATPLSATVAPLLSTELQGALERLQRLFPHALYGTKRKREPDLTPGFHDDGVMDISASNSVSAKGETRKFLHFASSAVASPTSHRPRLLLVGRPGSGHSSHVAPALLHALEMFTLHSLESAVLHGTSNITPEEACGLAFLEARRSSPSVLYLPHLQQWWETAGGALRSSFLSLLSGIPPSCPVLLLATSDTPCDLLDPEIQSLFREEYGEVFSLTAPSEAQRRNFLQDLILRQAAEAPPPTTSTLPVEVLPLAPPPPPRQPSEQERHLLEEQEEDTLRELRLFLRQVTERLTYDRRFKVFTKPVDTKKFKDYRKVVRWPMDLSMLLTNIDKHRYITVSEFVKDADLIWQNALKYNNPKSGAIESKIRHRASALKDTMHAILREDLDEEFERECQNIKRRRMERASTLDSDPERYLRCSMLKKKRRKSKWSSGVLPKPKKKKLNPAVAVATLALSSSDSSSLSSLTEPSKNEHATKLGTALTNGHSPAAPKARALATHPKHSPAAPTPPKSRTTAKFPKHPQSKKSASSQTMTRPSRPTKSQTRVKSRTTVKSRAVAKPRAVAKERTKVKPRAVAKTQTTVKSQAVAKPRATVIRRRSVKVERQKKMATEQQKKHLQLLNSDRTSRKTTEPLRVDHRQLQGLLQCAAVKTEGVEVEPLEKLYSLLSQCIYRHRSNTNKADLIKDMKTEMSTFCGSD